MFRILTENKNKSDIEAELIARDMGCTIYEAIGLWEGNRELSLVIEIDGSYLFKVSEVAEAIRKMNDQESVYVQYVPSELYSITEKGRQCLKV